jgi:hypothetical protein
MTSWVAWAVLLVAAALLGFIGYHFSVRTLRIAAAGVAVALVVFITGYGLAHPARAPADLASSFTRGADELGAAVFRVLRLGHPVPRRAGPAGWSSPWRSLSATGCSKPGRSTGRPRCWTRRS